MTWHQITQHEFISEMVTLGVRYRPNFFPNGAWRQHGSILSAYDGNVLVGQFDSATGKGFVSRGKQTGARDTSNLIRYRFRLGRPLRHCQFLR
jgi:hypothetical protein